MVALDAGACMGATKIYYYAPVVYAPDGSDLCS